MNIEKYSQEYEQTHPHPVLRQEHAYGHWRFWLVLVVIACGLLVSAIRTQGAFADLARAGWGGRLGLVESNAAALAAELGVVVFMIERVQRDRRQEPQGWLVVGLLTCFAISASANFDQGLKARYPSGVQDWLDLGVLHVALLSSGIPVIVSIAGEVLGQYLATMTARNEALRHRWEVQMESWNQKLARSWASYQRQHGRAGDHAPIGSTLEVANPPDGNHNPSLEAHLAAISDRVRVLGGDGLFRRMDVEQWLGVRSSQAGNVIQYGLTQGRLERMSGYRYRLRAGRNQQSRARKEVRKQ